MYLGGNLGWAEYHFLQGLGEQTNAIWVSRYQDPFNKNVLAPAAALAQTDKVAAYNLLAPAFAKIKAQSEAFISSYGSDGQKTIDGWKADWPLIQGFLNDWGQTAAGVAVGPPAGSMAPVSLPLAYDQAPAIADSRTPSIFGPATSPGGAMTYVPGAGASVTVQSGTAPAGAPSTIMEWAPWIAGAAVVGLLLSGRRGH